jgi:hypothetical protein
MPAFTEGPTMKPRSISDVDWRTLQFAPFWAFQVVAGIDGHIDQDERSAFRQRIDVTSPPDGPLAKAILRELRADLEGLVSAWNADPRPATDGLRETGLILVGLPAKNSSGFAAMLMDIGDRVARASGGGIGRREQTALRGMAAMLGTDRTESTPHS